MVKWRDLEGTGMARMPRRYVVDDGEIGVYHCINRCVRRAFLCGTDEVSGKCFDHRKRFIQSRLEFLAGQFGIDVLAFAVMSNHLHVVVRNRPDVVKEWSDEEVARRWWMLFPKRRDDEPISWRRFADASQTLAGSCGASPNRSPGWRTAKTTAPAVSGKGDINASHCSTKPPSPRAWPTSI